MELSLVREMENSTLSCSVTTSELRVDHLVASLPVLLVQVGLSDWLRAVFASIPWLVYSNKRGLYHVLLSRAVAEGRLEFERNGAVEPTVEDGQLYGARLLVDSHELRSLTIQFPLIQVFLAPVRTLKH